MLLPVTFLGLLSLTFLSLVVNAAAASACSPYLIATDPVSFNAPCTATSCIAVAESMAVKLPNCTYNGINNKIEVQNALTSCNGGTTEDAGSPTTTTTTTDTTTATTPTPTSSSTTECTIDEYQSAESIWNAAAATSACAEYATSTALSLTIYTPCSATDCVAVLAQVATDFPDCVYDGANRKAELSESLTTCTGDSTSEVDSTTPVSTSSDSSSPIPASTASSTSCTSSEVNSMWNLYVSTATSDECAVDSTVNEYSIYILTACSSDCANKIKDLAEALPNCYYDYDSMNKKEDVLEELDDCEATSSHISITVYDDTIGLSPSAGSEAVTSSDTPSSAETTNAPASDSLLDTSSSGLLQSVAPNIASSGILYVWVLSMLLAGINQVL